VYRSMTSFAMNRRMASIAADGRMASLNMES